MSNGIFPYTQVWAAILAAHRINNGEYVKRNLKRYDNNKLSSDNKLTNLAIMKIILNDPTQSDITTEDYEKAKILHNHISSLAGLIFSGQARDYVKAAVQAASLIEIDINGMEIPLIASFPDSYNKNHIREDRRAELVKLENGSIPFRLNDL